MRHGAINTIRRQKGKNAMVFTVISETKKSSHVSLTNQDNAGLFFFDIRGVVHNEFVEENSTVNQFKYLEILKRLREAVR